ncbi:hypothetical protein OAB14_01570 [Amylibacter sp.]|nr:hypothetical protein [Amylibacter sp.]
MLTKPSSNPLFNDDVDLRELLHTLWAYKYITLIFCALGILWGVHKSNNTTPIYQSSAIFKNNISKSSMDMDDGANAVQLLAGINGSSTTSEIPLDKVIGLIFIKELEPKLELKKDEFYNSYDPNYVDPLWKSTVKKILGFNTIRKNTEEAVYHTILSNYKNNVLLENTEGGALKITVSHAIPERASKIANIIMNKLIEDAINKKNRLQDNKLNYLSNELLKAQNELILSQTILKDFTIKNSAIPLEDFAVGSKKLNLLREELNRTNELQLAVSRLVELINQKKTTEIDYKLFKKEYPIIDQISFRRILGLSEVISAWTWPNKNSALAVLNILLDRSIMIKNKIDTSEIEARKSGAALETYSRIMRQSKVSEAAYTVLIETLKTQDLMSGYNPAEHEIYEYASTAMFPTKPNKKLIIVVSFLIGFFLSIIFSLWFSKVRGTFNSTASLITASKTDLNINAKSLLKFRKYKLNKINELLIKEPQHKLRNLLVEIYKTDTKKIIITSSKSKIPSHTLGRVLANYLETKDTKVCIIELSNKIIMENNEKASSEDTLFTLVDETQNISLMHPNNLELFINPNFFNEIEKFSSSFDYVLISADNSEAISLLRTIEKEKVFHIMLARTKHTKNIILQEMRSIYPLQGFFYE